MWSTIRRIRHGSASPAPTPRNAGFAPRAASLYLLPMRRRWGFRGWAMVWAVLQFALPAAATLADARLERDGVDARAHVESQSDASCRPVHRAECALCQLVWRTSTLASGPSCVAAVVRVVVRPAIADRPWRSLAGAADLALARAPPLS
jgi:hypothetical protein